MCTFLKSNLGASLRMVPQVTTWVALPSAVPDDTLYLFLDQRHPKTFVHLKFIFQTYYDFMNITMCLSNVLIMKIITVTL